VVARSLAARRLADWTNPQSLTTAIRNIATHPIASDAASRHAHRH
jgi:hypothetical protein